MPVIINGSTGISGTDGSAGTPALQGTDGNTGMFFPAPDQIAFAEGGVEAMRLDASGNLGLGTTTPSTFGRLAVSTPTAGFGLFGIANSVGGGGGVQMAAYYGTAKISYIDTTLTNGTPGAETAYMAFATPNNGTLAERVRITSGGDVLIGTASNPNGRKMVVSTGGANQACLEVGSSFSGQEAVDCRNNASGGGALIIFRNNNTETGRISCTSSTTSYATSSDYRLKANVVPLTDASARVQALKPSRFNFIADPDRTVDGFIAHEAAEVVPEAINGEKDAVDAEGKPIYQGIDQSKLIPLLTAALQEALTEIAALKARVAALEATP